MGYDRSQRNNRSTRLVLSEVYMPIPKPEEDFHAYERISEALSGAKELLDEYRRNEGAVGYAALNAAMSRQKASIAWRVRGEEGDIEEADRYLEDMEDVIEQFQMATLPEHLAELLGSGLGHALAQVGRNPKLDMKHQERVEGIYAKLIWPVLTSPDPIKVPQLPTLRELGCPVQAAIAGIQDLPLEMATQLDPHMVRHSESISADGDIMYTRRFIAIMHSFYQKLEEFNGVPGYVVNNSFWRGSSFSAKQFRIKMLLIRQTGDLKNWLHGKKRDEEQVARIAVLLKAKA